MDNDSAATLDPTSTQIAREANDSSASGLNCDPTVSPIRISTKESTTFSASSSIFKSSTPLNKSVTTKKTDMTNKKKKSNMK